MSNDAVKGTRKLSSTNSNLNAISFLIENTVKGLVNTAIPVRVVSVDTEAGTLSALPLICQRDAFQNVLRPALLPRLPYSRIQGGKAAVIIDPEPGDVGLAVFAQSDCSNIRRGQSEPVQAGSFRSFDVSDGFYIGGFLNVEPEIYLQMTQEGEVKVHAPARVIIETGDVTVQASGAVTVEAETAAVNTGTANLTASGAVTVEAETAEITASDSAKIKAQTAEIEADEGITLNAPKITAEGVLTAQEVIAAGISLTTHIHKLAELPTTPPVPTAPAE